MHSFTMLNCIKSWLNYFLYMSFNVITFMILIHLFTYIWMVLLSLDHNQVTGHLVKVGKHFKDTCEFVSDTYYFRSVKDEL